MELEEEFEKQLLLHGRNARSVFERIYQKYDRIFEEGEAGGATAGLIKISLGDVEFPEDSVLLEHPYVISEDNNQSDPPDPELAALLHEKVIKEKQAINWDEAELQDQEKRQQRAAAAMKAATDSSSDSNSSDEEAPRVMHRGRSSFTSSWKRAKRSSSATQPLKAHAGGSVDESVDISENSMMPSESDDLFVTSAPECPLDDTNDYKLSISMYELGEGRSCASDCASPFSKLLCELGPAVSPVNLVSGGTPGNRDTDDTLTSPKKDCSKIEDDPYLDVQSGYETSTPVVSIQHSSTPKLRQRLRTQLQASPAIGLKLSKKFDSSSNGMEPRPGMESISTVPSTAPGMEPGSISSDEQKASSSAVESDTASRVVEKELKLNILKLPYNQTSNPACSRESVLRPDPLVYDVNAPTTPQDHSFSSHDQQHTAQSEVYQPPSPLTVTYHYPPHPHNLPPHPHSLPPTVYCLHNPPAPPPDYHHHHFCHHGNPVSHCSEHHTTTPANQLPPSSSSSSEQSTTLHTQPIIQYSQPTTYSTHYQHFYPPPPPPHYHGSFHRSSCYTDFATTTTDCRPPGAVEEPSNAASKRPLESSSSSETLPSKRSKR